MLEDRRLLASLVVTAATDAVDAATTPGTLRYAISQVNASDSATNAITFNFGGAATTIRLNSALPQIVKPVAIDGAQPNSPSTPSVEIVNGYAPLTDDGLSLGAGSARSVVKSLAIEGFYNGILIASADALIVSNFLGTDLSGSTARPNRYGLDVVWTGTGATIGGTAAGAGNLVSGNGNGVGVRIRGASCLVQGNTVGTDRDGVNALANWIGIHVGASGATIGGTAAEARNVVSGNTEVGIYIYGGSCLVEGNTVGADKVGTKAIPNGSGGIAVTLSSATIGGTAAGAGNLISGNAGDGIYLQVPSCLVQGNIIGADKTGTAPLPNRGGGVVLLGYSTHGNTIGGAAGAGNVIAFNGWGVVTHLGASYGASANTIRFNSIYGNGRPGIDLNADGVTPNSLRGANNTPVISSATGGVIVGKLNAAPNATYVLDFYASEPADASPSRPQGRDDIASTTVTTNFVGDAFFRVPYVPTPGRPIITAASTDAAGTTSEFSTPAGYALDSSGETFNARAGAPFAGIVATFAVSDPSATAANFTAAIDWGDGMVSAGTIAAGPRGFAVVGSHTFPAANFAQPVTVAITDMRPGISTTAHGLAVVAPPVLTPFAKVARFVEGASLARVAASFADADPRAVAEQFTAAIDWGDGAPSTAGVVTSDGAGFDVTGTHAYNRAGSFPIVVTIRDESTDSRAAVTSAAVVDAVPIAVLPKAFAVDDKKRFAGILAEFTDIGTRIDPAFYTAAVDWGDGSPVSAGTITGAGPFTMTASHVFPASQNIHLVTMTVTDKNGRTASAVERVVDPPPPPTPAAIALHAGGLTLPRRGPFKGVVASFNDNGRPLPPRAYRATIEWERGRKAAGMVVGANGRFVVLARTALRGLVAGGRVTITVFDASGRVASASETATNPVVVKGGPVKHPQPVKRQRRGR